MKLSELTPRRREIVELLSQGKSVKEIANELGTAYPTVSRQLTQIYRKVGVADRVSLLRHFFTFLPNT